MRYGGMAAVRRWGLVLLAFCVVALLIAVCLLPCFTSKARYALAADGASSGLKSAETSAFVSSDVGGGFESAWVEINTVKKRYPPDGTLAITMAGHDTTTVRIGGVSGKVKWTTSNKKVATVKSIGAGAAVITGMNPGKTKIKATCGKETLICNVTVTGVLPQKKTITLLQTTTLNLRSPKGVKVVRGSWKSSNEKCATISKSGKVVPNATGQTTITCVDSKKYKYKCVISVVCPSLFCRIDKDDIRTRLVDVPGGTVTYYYARFNFNNMTGNSVVLDRNALYYYPMRTNAGRFTMLAYNLQAGKPLDKAKQVVLRKSDANFGAFAMRYPTVIRNASHYCLEFKVGRDRYMGDFDACSGTMLRCVRS